MLALGADMVMHSTTKFHGGHSDLLGGVLVIKDAEVAKQVSIVCVCCVVWVVLAELGLGLKRMKRRSSSSVRGVHLLAPRTSNHYGSGHGLARSVATAAKSTVGG